VFYVTSFSKSSSLTLKKIFVQENNPDFRTKDMSSIHTFLDYAALPTNATKYKPQYTSLATSRVYLNL
jgi:hypothetical protein